MAAILLRIKFSYVAFLIPAFLSNVTAGQTYTISTAPVEGTTERRCYRDGFHFLTFIDDGNGTFAVRPHPGTDVNGWGSTAYVQPFLPGAVLRHTVYSTFTAALDHIEIAVTGQISRGANETYGDWSAQLNFQYEPSTKTVNGDGNYSIELSNTLPDGEDLNLYKIASNVLLDVPLQTGGCGDTGDMTDVQVDGDALDTTWAPPPECEIYPYCFFFPIEENSDLIINVRGRLNIVDTAAQGHPFCIAAAYKPNLAIRLVTSEPMIRFGAIFTDSQRHNFAADNVGITPLINANSPLTDFNFAVTFQSTALPGDGNDLDFDGILDGGDLSAGCGTCRGNLTGDRYVDGGDIAAFTDCLLGGDPETAGCACADLDVDGDVDFSDLGEFIARLLGEGIPCL